VPLPLSMPALVEQGRSGGPDSLLCSVHLLLRVQVDPSAELQDVPM
jgi:hypothetical protein